MAIPFDPKQIVTVQALATSTMLEIEALMTENPGVGGSIPAPGTDPLTLLRCIATIPLFVTVNDDKASTAGSIEL
jgi:hypothetical protein